MISKLTTDALDRYAKGIPAGGFLNAVLENDLTGALMRADSDNLPVLKEIMAYMIKTLPYTAFGSPENVEKWLRTKHE